MRRCSVHTTALGWWQLARSVLATHGVPVAASDRLESAKAAAAGVRPRMRNMNFFRLLGQEIVADGIDDVAAMMAYYAMLALFPMLVFVITLTLLVLPGDTLIDGVRLATAPLPRAIALELQQQATRMQATAGAGFAVGSAVFALWGASRGASSLTLALNQVFEKRETRPWWRRQLRAIGVTGGIALLILVVLAVIVTLPLGAHGLLDRVGGGATFDAVWSVLQWVIAGVAMMTMWAMLYRFLPDTDAPFRVFTPGAAIGVLLWLGICWLFGLYLDNFNSYETTYGALGGVIIFVTWLWLSNLAFLLGAVINDVLAAMRAGTSDAARILDDPYEHERNADGSVGR